VQVLCGVGSKRKIRGLEVAPATGVAGSGVISLSCTPPKLTLRAAQNRGTAEANAKGKRLADARGRGRRDGGAPNALDVFVGEDVCEAVAARLAQSVGADATGGSGMSRHSPAEG
jgi:hypothetical protein